MLDLPYNLTPMRIVREINHYPCKITLMEYGGRYNIKFEDSLSAITLKLISPDAGMTPDEIMEAIDPQLVKKVLQQLNHCNEISLTHFYKPLNSPNQDDDDII